VDGTAINVDFSSLRAGLNYNGTLYDIELWPFTTSLTSNSFNPADNTFNIGWSESTSIDLNIFGYTTPTPITFEVDLGGHLTLAPLPAAVWLFGMGLVSLLGLSLRKR
jgi:hypothetical protein